MAFIVKRDAVVTPAGIPVASTTSVIITLSDNPSNSGTFAKKVPQQLLISYGGPNLYSNIAGTCYVLGGLYGGTILFSPDAQAWNDLDLGDPQFGTPFGEWKIGQIDYDGENDLWFFTERARNGSTNVNYIPTIGWTFNGSPVAITIIAG